MCATSVATNGTSVKTKAERPVPFAAVKSSLMLTRREGYAKGCTALTHSATAIDLSQLVGPVLIVSGAEYPVSPPKLAQAMKVAMVKADVTLEVLGELCALACLRGG